MPSIDDIILDYERMFAKPDDPNALVVQGTIFGSRGSFEEAMECFNRAIEIDPNLADAWYNKGIVLINQQNLTGALECMQKTVDLDPNFTAAWLKMGSLYRRLGNYDKALQALKEFKLGMREEERGPYWPF